jgi:hypothetical protein
MAASAAFAAADISSQTATDFTITVTPDRD